MDRKQSGIIFFAIVAFILYAFGVELFERVWSFPSIRKIPLMVIALVGTGVFATVRLGFPQIKYLMHGINVTAGKYDNPKDEGDLNHFQALTTALSATVGVGNIAGVATAMYYGGPGALFWMWITAFFGTTLKYAECTLSVKYREINSEGFTAGGPMYTIENGMGKKWKWLAVAFAGFAIICSFATGNAIQSFTISDQIYSESVQLLGGDHFLTENRIFLGFLEFNFQQIIIGIILAALVGAVIIGGIKRIGQVTSYLAPIMAVIYVFSSILVLIYHVDKIGESFGLIFNGVFNPKATIIGAGGGAVMTMLNTMLMGIKRGLYSNEAGQGSAAIAHSAAKTNFPVREGAVAMLGPYIDTIITARPVANFFGGDIMEPVFDWLYFTADWNVNNYGNIFAKGMYSCLMIWLLLALVCYFVLSRTQAGNWIYSTGGNLGAAQANGVPTNKVKISLFMFTAFCATMFAACQVFEVNTADTAKGNLKELEAIAAAVIGGVVLTGGFGTILGIILGTIIFGIAKEAFFYIPGIDGSFYRVFLGAVLVAAALTNENIRKRIIGSI